LLFNRRCSAHSSRVCTESATIWASQILLLGYCAWYSSHWVSDFAMGSIVYDWRSLCELFDVQVARVNVSSRFQSFLWLEYSKRDTKYKAVCNNLIKNKYCF
jgi:hypothetical protein